jgi:hypothetical protein
MGSSLRQCNAVHSSIADSKGTPNKPPRGNAESLESDQTSAIVAAVEAEVVARIKAEGVVDTNNEETSRANLSIRTSGEVEVAVVKVATLVVDVVAATTTRGPHHQLQRAPRPRSTCPPKIGFPLEATTQRTPGAVWPF